MARSLYKSYENRIQSGVHINVPASRHLERRAQQLQLSLFELAEVGIYQKDPARIRLGQIWPWSMGVGGTNTWMYRAPEW